MKLQSFHAGISSNSMRILAARSDCFSVSLEAFHCGLWGHAVDISALRRGKVGVTPWKSRGNAVENSASSPNCLGRRSGHVTQFTGDTPISVARVSYWSPSMPCRRAGTDIGRKYLEPVPA